MIEKEIKKINSNIEYKHTIEPIDMNPYLLQVNLFFDDKLGQILIENFGNNIVKFNLKINNKYYPLIPPELDYISPPVKSKFLYEITNLKDLKIENWNYFVELEYIIISLANELKDKLEPFLKFDEEEEKENFKFESKIIKFMNLTNEPFQPVANINLGINKLTLLKDPKYYWESGTGYGHNKLSKWDVKAYQRELENNKNLIIF